MLTSQEPTRLGKDLNFSHPHILWQVALTRYPLRRIPGSFLSGRAVLPVAVPRVGGDLLATGEDFEAANNIADHVAVLDQAISQLPAEVAAGHCVDDDPALVRRRVRVRTDSAGCTNFVWHARARNVGFAVVARSNAQVHAAISRVRFDAAAWQQALRQDGDERPGAAVAELTDLVDLTDWPEGTRLIVRREPLHPGAQGSLFPSETYRYWGHYTDDTDSDPVELDVAMRAHAHVEDNIRRLKDSGAQRFPFTDISANRAWLAVVCFADALVRWFQLLCLTGPLAGAEPKTLRWTLWHTPARIIRRSRQHVVRILHGWPTAGDLLDAYQRIPLIT